MTNKDAVKILQLVKEDAEKQYHVSIGAALDMAISALERDRWQMIQTRPMDEDERKEWSEKLGYDIEYEEAVIYTGPLPDDGQEVLVYKHPWGGISIDKFEEDPDYGCSFEENGDMDGIVAWMPLPEPPKEEI